MPLRLVYSVSLVPCRDEAVEAVLSRHVDFKLKDSFRLVVPDLESRLDLERELLADPRLGEVLIGKSLLTWPSLLQGFWRELPEFRPPPSPALQRRALRLALSEAGLDWKLDLDSERRLLGELQRILRQRGEGLARAPGAALGRAWQAILAERFQVWTAEEAAERIWRDFSRLACRELSDLREIFVLGFRSLEPLFLRGISALLQKWPDVTLHLYLPPRDSLVGEEGRWLDRRDALESLSEGFEEWRAAPAETRSLIAFSTVVHEAGKILAEGFPRDTLWLLPAAGELGAQLEARYLAALGLELPAPDGSHSAIGVELFALLERDSPENPLELRAYLEGKEEVFAKLQARLAQAGDGEGLRLLEGFLQRLREQVGAQSLFPERRMAAEWLAELREEWLDLRLSVSNPTKQLPWRRLDRPGLASRRRLWMAGLQEGLLPAKRSAAFFEDEQAFAWDAWEEKLGFEQALHLAEAEILFSHAEFSLDGRPETLSPWVDAWLAEGSRRAEEALLLQPRRRFPYWEENLHREIARRASLPLGPDAGNLSALGLEAELLTRMIRQPLSPTYLDDLAKCPWSFFARRHLRLAKEPEEDLEIDPRRRGSLQHRLLESVFAALLREHFETGKRPSLAEVEAVLARVFAALAEETMAVPSEIPPVLLRDQLERMREVARFVLTEEQACWTEAPRRLLPRHLEWSFGKGPVPPLEVEVEAGRRLPLKGQIDRVDLSEDGKYFLLIDYKSSRAQELASELREGLSLQLWIYLKAVRQSLLPAAEPIGALYWDLKAGQKNQGMARRNLYKNFTHKAKFGNSKSLLKDEDYEALADRLEGRLKALLKRALSGDYSLQPEKCSGSHCDYFEICRYGNKPRN